MITKGGSNRQKYLLKDFSGFGYSLQSKKEKTSHKIRGDKKVEYLPNK